MRLKHYIVNYELDEAAYDGNLGFEELVKFYKVADDTEINKMEEIIKDADWKSFKMLIQKVVGVKLK